MVPVRKPELGEVLVATPEFVPCSVSDSGDISNIIEFDPRCVCSTITVDTVANNQPDMASQKCAELEHGYGENSGVQQAIVVPGSISDIGDEDMSEVLEFDGSCIRKNIHNTCTAEQGSVEDSEDKSGSASPVIPESECVTMTVDMDHSVNDNHDMEPCTTAVADVSLSHLMHNIRQ